MASRKTPASGPAKKSAAKRVRGKLAPVAATRGLERSDVVIASDAPELSGLASLVSEVGGAVIGAYRDPLGGRPLVLASLPLSAVQPTPFQRDLSPTHAKRLSQKIDETQAFLDL